MRLYSYFYNFVVCKEGKYGEGGLGVVCSLTFVTNRLYLFIKVLPLYLTCRRKSDCREFKVIVRRLGEMTRPLLRWSFFLIGPLSGVYFRNE